MENTTKHFFISYNKADRQWAEWIAWQLEQVEYTAIIQAWDFRPGLNFVQQMHKAVQEAERTIAVLSSNYLNTLYTYPEWEAAFRRDPLGEQGGILVPVRIQECKPPGLLGLITYIDLVGLDEETARKTLLEGVHQGRSKPTTSPRFPGKISEAQRSVTQQPRFPGQFSPIKNIPYQRNPFFTGREEIVKHLHNTFTKGKAAALTQTQAIIGLGGIGKTQTAVEYAYRYAGEYQTVLWVRGDSREALESDFVRIANFLDLPKQNQQDQKLVVNAVKHWLQTNSGWLLIFDNVEDLGLLHDFIPSLFAGHILLTTQAQAIGTLAESIEIERMQRDEGALFLLRRAKLIDRASEEDWAKAEEISETLDGLPLALDQAGAFIEETTCSLSEYLRLYLIERVSLLQERGGASFDHPESVAVTFLLAFEKIEKANCAAADLLRLCAFLSPDDIPEEIMTEGAADLGPLLQPLAANQLQLKKAIATLRKYSLVRRDPNAETLSIHRLLQVVSKDGMDEDTQRLWAERAVRSVSHVFPFHGDLAELKPSWRYIPHAYTCAAYIEQWNMAFPEATDLLHCVRIFEMVDKILSTIPPKFRAMLVLTYYYDLSDEEMASALNLPVTMIRRNLSHARRLWQNSLKQYGFKVSRHT